MDYSNICFSTQYSKLQKDEIEKKVKRFLVTFHPSIVSAIMSCRSDNLSCKSGRKYDFTYYLLKFHFYLGFKDKYDFIGERMLPFGIRYRVRNEYKRIKEEYLKEKGITKVADDDDFVKYLLLKAMPTKIFSDDDIIIWQGMYHIATTKMPYSFTYMYKNNHRKKGNMTDISFIEFRHFLEGNPQLQSNDRFFVAYYQKLTDCTVQEKGRVDFLLRNYTDRKYFSDNDVHAITENMCTEQEFFDVISVLNKRQKK